MGIDIPDLDDRSYQEYLEQAKKLIPAYSDEWTDFNPHDPGITILEVLAWMTETHTYQLDQITDAHREKYLQLMGYQRQLQEPATADVSLDPPRAAAGTRIPAGTRFLVTDGANDSYRFETDHDIVLADVSVDRVITVKESDRIDNSQENATDGMFYRAFGSNIDRGDALYLGFDGDPFASAQSLTLTVDYHDESLPSITEDGDASQLFDPSVELQWEYCLPDGSGWQKLTVASDRTNTLYQGGTIELSVSPGEPASDQVPEHVDISSHGWLRCRVERSGYEIPPQLNTIAVNVVTASHRATVTDEKLDQVASLGEPTALNDQTYETEHSPLLSAEIRVNGEPFVAVPDFDASGPTDPHYTLDRAEGTVTFGDGEQGRVPPGDATITADYVYGGGEDGCVSPSAAWQFENPATSVGDEVTLSDITIAASGATGGRDRENITAALERARRDLRTSHRGVTTADYESLAARTPGLRIGRTNVLVNGDEVSVIVVPYAPPDIPRPTPSEGFLNAVERYVSKRAMLGDRVNVSGPTYVGLDVTVTGQAQRRYTDGSYVTDIRAAIESYVHPLAGYEGDGWPFGRSLTAGELADQIEQLDGIDDISDIEITAHGGTSRNNTVDISGEELFAVVDISTDLKIVSTEENRL
jgi:predicted phage baseplate assembly protein